MYIFCNKQWKVSLCNGTGEPVKCFAAKESLQTSLKITTDSVHKDFSFLHNKYRKHSFLVTEKKTLSETNQHIENTFNSSWNSQLPPVCALPNILYELKELMRMRTLVFNLTGEKVPTTSFQNCTLIFA